MNKVFRFLAATAALVLILSPARPPLHAQEGTEGITQDPFTDIGATLTGVQHGAVDWGDYDSDNDLDILMSSGRIYRNDGGGTFSDIGAGLWGDWPADWGDYDNDGDLDVLLEENIYRNDGGGVFTATVTGPWWNRSAAWGDYDNDGDLDFLAGDDIYRNEGSDHFVHISLLPYYLYGSAAAWGDYDNDGDLDVLLTGEEDFDVPLTKLLRNDGGDVFSEISTGLTGVAEGAVAWGDYDNDGNLDILLTGCSAYDPDYSFCTSETARVYRNNGGGNFSSVGWLTGVYDSAVAWGDYDNDGNLDVLLAGCADFDMYCGECVDRITQVYRNVGGSFTDIDAGLIGVEDSAVAWGDYDEDGDLDILLTGSSDSGTVAKIYRNNATTANTAPAAPAGLAATVAGWEVTFHWDAANDDHTPANGLSYNLRVGTTPGGMDLVAPMAAADGYRRVPQLGNAQHGLNAVLRGLEQGTYYWSVQAIDTAWAGSAFAGEGGFAITVTRPSAGFTPSSQTVAVGQVVTFTNTTTGTEPIDYLWDFGDGVSSTLENPSHAYLATGAYTVVLSAANAYGADTADQIIIVTEEGGRIPCDVTALIAAIDAANSSGQDAVLELTPGCIYLLTAVDNTTAGPNGLPSITGRVTIQGNGATIARGSGAPDFRLFYIAVGGDLTLNDLTISSGRVQGEEGGDSAGGSLYNAGTLTSSNNTLSDNQSVDGSPGEPGSGGDAGGGSRGSGGEGGEGTCGYSDGWSGSSGSSGSPGSDGGPGNSGSPGTSSSGGIEANSGTANLENTLLGGNTASSAPDCQGTLTSQGHNLVQSTAGCTLAGDPTGNIIGQDPRLGPLQDNGGRTWTHALLADSPALDAGDNDSCPATDQRGIPRPQDGDDDGSAVCDIGAYEYSQIASVIYLPIILRSRPAGEPTPTPSAPTPTPTPFGPTATPTPTPSGPTATPTPTPTGPTPTPDSPTPTPTTTPTPTPTSAPDTPTPTPTDTSLWQIETVDSAGGLDASLALEGNGRPHISYYATNGDLMYAHFDGTAWLTETVDSTWSLDWSTSLALDGADQPHISYYDWGNGDLKYAHFDGTAWLTETVDSTGDVGWSTSLALDGSGRPHISYYDATNGGLKYAYFETFWQIETVDSAGDVGGYTSLALDGAGRPHISYYDWGNDDLEYAYYDGTFWQVETVDSTGDVGSHTSLALDGSGRPHISYYDVTNGDLKYTHYNGTSWQTGTVDSAGDVGGYTSLALDAAGRPHISYYDVANGDLEYAYYDGTTWQIETVDSAGDVGGYTSLALDGAGRPHISYRDSANGDLKYAWYSGGFR